MERTLERLLQIQAAMEELAVALEQAEGVRDAWEPVGDLFIDSLQDHIDATKVRHTRLQCKHALLCLFLFISVTHTHIHTHTCTHIIMKARYKLVFLPVW